MIEAILAGLFGLLIGSFLNVCIYRMPRDLSVVRPRSYCPHCEHTIAWYDNIPVLSYLYLHARCRYCAASIPVRYPIVELLTGILFAIAVLLYGPTAMAAKMCMFAAIIVALVGSDLEERILPDEFTLGGAVAGFAWAWFVPLEAGISHVVLPGSGNLRLLSMVEAALGAVVSSGSILLVAKVYEIVRKREGMGLGDVKMVAMIGAFLGLQSTLLTLVLGSLSGGVGGLLFIVATRKDAATYELPFGAFLGAAALGVAMFGTALIQWYLRLGM